MVINILSKSPNGLFLIFERSVQFDFTIRHLLKLLLVAETDYSHFFIKLRKLNEKFKGISKPYHHMSKKTHTVNQMRRAINAVIDNIVGANNMKLKDLHDDQIIQIYVEASALNQNWLKLTGNEGVRHRKRKKSVGVYSIEFGYLDIAYMC